MKILKASDDRRLEEKSSIDQYKNFLSVYRQGGWVPIAYDVLESIGCDGARTHRAIMTDDKDWGGYHYPVATCRRLRGKHLLTDHQGTELKDLPEWQGEGKYEDFVDELRITNADNEAVGTADQVSYKVGLNYYACKKTAPAVE